METQKYYVLENNNYSIRVDTLQGKTHIIVPVVMLVEGVHEGSAGPILHTSEELQKFPNAWNGIPVVIGHPKDNGQFVSANSPTIVDREVIGRVFNTNVNNNKLKGEVWIEEEKIKQVSPLAYAYIMQQKPLDVSVGVFSDYDFMSGEWNGESYIAIAHNYRPDHLALLPNEKGACSWSDGCGIRVNSNGSLLDVIELIRNKLYSMDSSNKSYYLREVYDDNTFIYEVNFLEEGKKKYYKRSYQVNDKNDEVNFLDDIEEVEREINYKKISTLQGDFDIMDKVKQLLTIAPNLYNENDEKWLETLSNDQIDKLIKCAESNINSNKENEKLKGKIETMEKNMNNENIQINEDSVMEFLKEKVSDIDTFSSLLPKQLRDQFEYGQKLYKKHRNVLISHIVTNQAQKVWTDEELKDLDTETLQKIADSIKKPVSYEGAGGINSYSTNNDVLLPPGVVVNKED